MHIPASVFTLITLIQSCMSMPNKKSESVMLGSVLHHKFETLHANAEGNSAYHVTQNADVIIPSLQEPRCKTECNRIWLSPLWPQPDRVATCYTILCRDHVDPDEEAIQYEESLFAKEAVRRCHTLGVRHKISVILVSVH